MKRALLFLRKPLKPILYSIIFCVLFLVALVFALQYELDKIAIEETVNTYSYVGTIYDNKINTPLLKDLPENLVRRISNSKYTSDAENRKFFSGRTEKTNAILDYFITDDTIDKYGMLEGHVKSLGYDSESGVEKAVLTVQKNWAGVLYGQSKVEVTVWRDESWDTNPTEPLFHDNDRVLLIGRFQFDRTNNGMKFTSLEIRNPSIKSAKNILDNNPVIYIPEEYDRGATDEYIKSELEKRDMLQYIDKIMGCRYTFGVRPVTDMSMLMSFAGYSSYICGGRGITKADKGKKVCVIHQFVASKNGLKVGDHIKLGVSDSAFLCTTATHDATWESGYPKIDDEFPEYGEFEEYEIIGFFNFYTRRNCEEDFFKFSTNDIFIPSDQDELADFTGVKPCNFSFRIYGPDYEDFMDEFEIELFDAGYILHTVDAGWEDFQANYESMMSRKLVSLVSACLSFLVAVSLFVILLIKHFKYEFGLRRLLGASTVEASGIYLAGYFALGVPAILLSMAATCVIYVRWLYERMTEVIEEGLPTTVGCVGLLSNWIAFSFAGGLLLMIIVALINGKKNLLGMIK